jgi:uncharacterized membrane protein
MVMGSVVMVSWEGPRRRVTAVIGAVLIVGVAFILAGLRPSLPIIALSAFSMYFAVPLANGYDLAIWQSTSAAEVQGRLLATRNMVITGVLPLAFGIAGPLGDRVFSRMLTTPEQAGWLGAVIGVGPGRGLAFFMVILGFLVLAVGFAASTSRTIRNVEGPEGAYAAAVRATDRAPEGCGQGTDCDAVPSDRDGVAATMEQSHV